MDRFSFTSSILEKIPLVAAAVLFFGAPQAALADLKLPSIFSNNMVVQRDKPVAIWGTAEPNETIGVKLGKQQAGIVADAKGRWKVSLNPQSAGGPYELIIAGHNQTKTVKNVMVGEVWLCSGQSNMALNVSTVDGGEDELANAKPNPNVRLCFVNAEPSPNLLRDAPAFWEVSSGLTARQFSAVGYFVAKKLEQELKVPVGVIMCACPQSRIESWMSRPCLESLVEGKKEVERSEFAHQHYVKLRDQFLEKMTAWKLEAQNANTTGKKLENPPSPPLNLYAPAMDTKLPASCVFNSFINPIIGYTIKGVLWYQGESNVGEAGKYQVYFPALIRDYRKLWGQDNMPFCFVQLGPASKPDPLPAESTIAALREAQSRACLVPGAQMAVAIDACDAETLDWHFTDKRIVADRLARILLATQYNKPVRYKAPIFDSQAIDGEKIRVFFRNADRGLTAKGNEIKGFAIAGPDRKFVWAQAEIEGGSVKVWNDKVPHPTMVRYAWANHPLCNLYGADGIPVAPFRSSF